jgi:two-component sensor histidine kinase
VPTLFVVFRSDLWKNWLAPALLLAGIWCLLAGLFAGQFVVTGNMEWDEALSRSTSFWLPWLPLLPLTWLLTRALLHHGARLPASIAAHTAACAAAIVLCHILTPDRPGNARPENMLPQPEGRPLPLPQAEPQPRDNPPPRSEGPGPRGENPGPRGEGPGPPWMRGNNRRGPPPGVTPYRPRPWFGPFGFRSIIDAVVYGGVVSLTYALGFLRRSQQRERRALELEASLSRARLDALRLQINPHFLFNTLNAVTSLIHTRPEAADEMIGSLSELLRASLQGSGHHEIPLSRELELLRLFTGIEQTRFGDRIRFVESIAPETATALVPSLVLQPIVENAVRHGTEPLTGAGTVTIATRREDDRLILTVQDDGAGYDPLAEPKGTGIGLSNTRARLQALYGTQQSLTLSPAPDRGTLVTLSIPWHTA